MESAKFHCRYWNSNTRIAWKVNDLSMSQFPDITTGSLIENGNKVNTLTIPVRSEYNGTEVVCLALFQNGSYEETLPATMTIDHNFGFEEIPSPSSLILAVGDTYTYKCNHSKTDLISWRINQSVLGAEIFPPNVTNLSIHFSDGRRVHTLTIGGLPEHNRTTIQCSAAFSNRQNPDMSPIVTFLTQG